MPYVETYVDPAEFIGELDDEDLIDELESRGYSISPLSPLSPVMPPDLSDVIWRYKNGYIEDAVQLLIRQYPELYGLDKYINGVKNVT